MEISKAVEKVFADQAQQDLIQDLCQRVETLKAKLADARETLRKIGDVSYCCNEAVEAKLCLERIGKRD